MLKQAYIVLVLIAMQLSVVAQVPKYAVLSAKDNYRISPYSGYTRQHWLEIAGRFIAGALPCFNRETGMPEFPADSAHRTIEASSRLTSQKEALERVMTAVIFYTVATGGDTVPGYNGLISAPFVRAITKGTDPTDKAYWGVPEPYDQVGSMFALAVYLNPRLFWEPLNVQQRKNLLTYLQLQTNNSSYDNNHYFFHLAPAALLRANKVPFNEQLFAQRSQALMDCYRGQGWFIDGNNQGFDYYNSWGFQLYSQLLYRFDPVWKAKHGDGFKAAATEFLTGMPFFYGRDGGPVPYGRSLTYRFASLAAIGWAVYNQNSPLPPGQARRLASGCLRYFWEHGCLAANGIMNIGYWGHNPTVGESYGSPGSPYWAMQAFVCLLIPASDPFWTAKELPIPADAEGGTRVLKSAQMLIKVNGRNGEVRVYPAGQPFSHNRNKWQVGVKYDQQAYSSYLGWPITGDGGADVGAGRTGFSSDGKNWQYREQAKMLSISAKEVASVYSAGSGKIISHLLVGQAGEVQVFWHTNATSLYLYSGGYGISASGALKQQQDSVVSSITVQAGSYWSTMSVKAGPAGKVQQQVVKPRQGWSASHLFGGVGVFPYWQSAAPVPGHVPVVCYVAGGRDSRPFSSSINVKQVGQTLYIRFEGKNYTIHIDEA